MTSRFSQNFTVAYCLCFTFFRFQVYVGVWSSRDFKLNSKDLDFKLNRQTKDYRTRWGHAHNKIWVVFDFENLDT